MVAKFVGSFGLMRYSSLESQSVEAIPPATPNTDLERQQALRAEAEVHFLQVLEAADHQSRGDEQQHGEGHFHHYENFLERFRPFSKRLLTRPLPESREVEARVPQGWSHTEQYTRQDRDQKSERHHRSIDPGPLEDGDLWRAGGNQDG